MGRVGVVLGVIVVVGVALFLGGLMGCSWSGVVKLWWMNQLRGGAWCCDGVVGTRRECEMETRSQYLLALHSPIQVLRLAFLLVFEPAVSCL